MAQSILRAGADSTRTKASSRYSAGVLNNKYDLGVTPENYTTQAIGDFVQ